MAQSAHAAPQSALDIRQTIALPVPRPPLSSVASPALMTAFNAHTTQQVAAGLSGTDLLSRSLAPDSELSLGMVPPLAQTPPAFQGATTAATGVSQQLAGALRAQPPVPGRVTELALDPPELGRVRMSVSDIAGVLTLVISAERPETADLMRRHMGLLAEEFQRNGVDSPHVSISHDGAGTGSGERHTTTAPAGLTEAKAEGPTDQPLPKSGRSSEGNLDLRL